LVGPDVTLIETGEPVARQTRRLLETVGLLNNDSIGSGGIPTASPKALANVDPTPCSIRLLTTGPLPMLQAAAQRWLDLPPACCEAAVVP
ncbi:MAG: glutamate racemase, partial [Gammaproteobacteria bacterium]|nr:glutamate racemase [Gammaproteobacteria bacterium]